MSPFNRTALSAVVLSLLATTAAHAQARSADLNGDGVVTPQEYLTVDEARFKRMDRDHNGIVDQAELAMVKRFLGDRTPRVTRALDKMAADGGGQITHDEFIDAAKARFAMADTNHDGGVDKAEEAAAKAKLDAEK
jgi:hypothetical protein